MFMFTFASISEFLCKFTFYLIAIYSCCPCYFYSISISRVAFYSWFTCTLRLPLYNL